MKLLALFIGTACMLPSVPLQGEEARPTLCGNAVIRAAAGQSEIVITTTQRLAGAIHSLTWGGKEFIDSHDHGRQLQSAASFNAASQQPFWAECFNPTEAGSRADGLGETSSSRLLRIRAEGNELNTTTQMAFWLAPGEQSFGRPAINDKVLSHHLISKRVRIGYKMLPQVIEYDVTFTVPQGEYHTYAQFEALTGYMPIEFSRFWKFVPNDRTLQDLEPGEGEQKYPVVLATDSGSHAMGIFSPDQPSAGFEGSGYGRFRFEAERVVKWNCVFRLQNNAGVLAGNYHYHMFVAVGTLSDVKHAIDALVQEFSP